MKQLFSVFLLISFCYYSILGNESNEHHDTSIDHGSSCILEKNETSDCCQLSNENIEDTDCSHSEEESNKSCEKTCCEDYCCCIKILKTPLIVTSPDIIIFPVETKPYVDMTIFSFQQYTINIFKPPKRIV